MGRSEAPAGPFFAAELSSARASAPPDSPDPPAPAAIAARGAAVWSSLRRTRGLFRGEAQPSGPPVRSPGFFSLATWSSTVQRVVAATGGASRARRPARCPVSGQSASPASTLPRRGSSVRAPFSRPKFNGLARPAATSGRSDVVADVSWEIPYEAVNVSELRHLNR